MTLRVVLDTTVVLSALLFRAGRTAWVRHAWQSGRLRPVVCRGTAAELLRVLAYPKFSLSAAEQDELLADFLPFAETFALAKIPAGLPTCRDRNDQVFLALARAAKVDALVTGDAALLALRPGFSPPVLTVGELKSRIAG